MSTVAIDIGSRRMGLVDGEMVDGSPKIHAADVLYVTDDLHATVADLLAWLRTGPKPTQVVIEHNPVPYMPLGCTPQQAQQLAEHYARCSTLCVLIVAMLGEHGIPVVPYTTSGGKRYTSIPRQAWAHRLLLGHSGGISQHQAREAVGAYLSDADLELLVGDDRLDAAGALLWALLPPVERRSRARNRTGKPRPKLEREPPTPEQAYARARVQRGAVPALVKPMGRGNAGCCRLCGGLRKGHLRGLPCPPVVPLEAEV